jgi:hypothetical protein
MGVVELGGRAEKSANLVLFSFFKPKDLIMDKIYL